MTATRKRLLLSLAVAVIFLSFVGLQLCAERQIISGKGSYSGNVVIGMLLQAFGRVYTGTGLTGDGSAGAPVSVDTTAVPTRLSNTTTLTWGAISPGATPCAELPINLPGATAGDEVMQIGRASCRARVYISLR